MASAATSSIDIGELQAAASRTISDITGAEAGIVTTGASAALTLACAASMTRWDIAKMAALPHAESFAHEVLIMRTHRTGYSHALRASGARLVDIGHNDRGTGAGVRGIEPWEIEASITSKTAAFAFSATPENMIDLPTVVSVCRLHNIPVIVDAAAQLPPKSNLRRIFELGADLVAFSGGKAIGGPQASGILAGRRDLVGAALIQQLDMDVAPETWMHSDLIDRVALKGGVPHHGLGRGFKAGKEEIVGLIVALERFANADDEAINASLALRLKRIAKNLDNLPGISLQLVSAKETGRVPQLRILIDVSIAKIDALGLSRALQCADTPVHLSERFAQHGMLIIDPQVLREDDEEVLVATFKGVLPSQLF
jgi:L-seryl-tRNA(Ser) seleniumtransferase